MKRMHLQIPLLLAALILPFASHAHRMWIEPSATVLSAEEPWVTFNAAISNELFHPNYYPFPVDRIQVLSPSKKTPAKTNTVEGKLRSVFDLQLTEPGTYKVYAAHTGLRATWIDDSGERQYWPGRGETPAPGEFEKAVPQQAKDLEVTRASRRMETYVTAGAPTESVFDLQNRGLELQPVTHPNDLYAGEEAEFRLFMDGAPAAGAKVSVLKGDMRYRNSQEAQEFTADDKGAVRIKWQGPGKYWFGAEYEDDEANEPADKRTGSYIAVFEVLPQ